jgi:Rad3-related DNA helicase
MEHPILPAAVRDFRLRNEPYPIQVDFMNDLLTCFDQGSIGFFESPTGTGKSLSVLCASIAYIREKNRSFSKQVLDSDSDSDEFDDRPKRSKLIIATRTHSQIKELVSELRKLKESATTKIASPSWRGFSEKLSRFVPVLCLACFPQTSLRQSGVLNSFAC